VPDDGAIHILKVGPGILERHSHPMLRHADQRETLNRRHEGRHTSVEGVIAHHQQCSKPAAIAATTLAGTRVTGMGRVLLTPVARSVSPCDTHKIEGGGQSGYVGKPQPELQWRGRRDTVGVQRCIVPHTRLKP